MSTIWFTSDHHFSHKNIIKYEDRPFGNTWHMNTEMTKRWNEVVKPEDTVYYLGDFTFGKREDVAILSTALNGVKTLIRGNHDRGSELFLKAGFVEVVDRKTIDIDGIPVLLCHYPYAPKPSEEDKDYHLKYMERRPKNEGGWLIHGHVHGHWKISGKMICVAVENWDYYPVNIETIKQIIKGEITS